VLALVPNGFWLFVLLELFVKEDCLGSPVVVAEIPNGEGAGPDIDDFDNGDDAMIDVKPNVCC
jgi:hypothetical protein